MIEPTAQKLTELAREFIDKLRAHLSQTVSEEPEQFVERALGIGATLVALAMMALRADSKNQAIVVALLQVALRRFTGRSKAVVIRG